MLKHFLPAVQICHLLTIFILSISFTVNDRYYALPHVGEMGESVTSTSLVASFKQGVDYFVSQDDVRSYLRANLNASRASATDGSVSSRIGNEGSIRSATPCARERASTVATKSRSVKMGMSGSASSVAAHRRRVKQPSRRLGSDYLVGSQCETQALFGPSDEWESTAELQKERSEDGSEIEEDDGEGQGIPRISMRKRNRISCSSEAGSSKVDAEPAKPEIGWFEAKCKVTSGTNTIKCHLTDRDLADDNTQLEETFDNGQKLHDRAEFTPPFRYSAVGYRNRASSSKLIVDKPTLAPYTSSYSSISVHNVDVLQTLPGSRKNGKKHTDAKKFLQDVQVIFTGMFTISLWHAFCCKVPFLKFILCFTAQISLNVHQGIDEDLHTKLASIITRRGGTILNTLDRSSSKATRTFCVSAPTAFRRLTYFKALALGTPLVHYMWLERSDQENNLYPFEKYLLPAGGSSLQPYFVMISPSSLNFAGRRIINWAGDDWTEILKWTGASIENISKASLLRCLDKGTHFLNLADFILFDSSEGKDVRDIVRSHTDVDSRSIEWLAHCLCHGRELSVTTSDLFSIPKQWDAPLVYKKNDGSGRYAKYDLVYYTSSGMDKKKHIGWIQRMSKKNSNTLVFILAVKTREFTFVDVDGKSGRRTGVELYLTDTAEIVLSSDRLKGKVVVLSRSDYMRLYYCGKGLDKHVYAASEEWIDRFARGAQVAKLAHQRLTAQFLSQDV